MSDKADKLGNLRMQIIREELIEHVQRHLPADGVSEPFPGFMLGRSSKPMEVAHCLSQPAFCFVIKGSKRALLGDEVFWYDPGHYLLFTVDLPIVFRIENATVEEPYLGFTLLLDPKLVASVMMEAGIKAKKSDASAKAIDVNKIDVGLLDPVVRLFRLFDKPVERKIFTPFIVKEIIYRLLTGGEGARLSHLVAATGDTHRISKAIGYLREHFAEPLKIESMARELGMSVSGFHHHFKSVTAMSPLQFQKHIRLQEARRLMLGEDMDAASAGFRVGYEDPSYFSRDYKKQFGAPPQRDIVRLRSHLEV